MLGAMTDQGLQLEPPASRTDVRPVAVPLAKFANCGACNDAAASTKIKVMLLWRMAKFAVDDLVRYTPVRNSAGNYIVVRLMPSEERQDEQHYRIRSEVGNEERVVSESTLSPQQE